MPMAVMPQPMRIAPALALAAMFCGSEKIPPPIIEPTTSAISAPSFNCFEVVAMFLFPFRISTGDIGRPGVRQGNDGRQQTSERECQHGIELLACRGGHGR